MRWRERGREDRRQKKEGRIKPGLIPTTHGIAAKELRPAAALYIPPTHYFTAYSLIHGCFAGEKEELL